MARLLGFRNGWARDGVGMLFRRGVALWLCVGMVAGTLPAGAAAGKAVGGSQKAAARGMAAEERAIHLLNRFSFGPTEADLAEVNRLGVDGWFERQLYPERIADTGLEARLTQFPALRMPVNDLLWRFPDGAAIRAAANGKREIPADPELKAVYERQIALYREKQEEKLAKKDGEDTGKDDAEVKPADAAAVAAVERLAPAARVNRVLGMGTEEYAAFREAVKGPAQREKLLAGMTAEEREMLEDFEAPERTVVDEEQAQRLLREIYSSRQLNEVMTNFWMNHFNVYLHKNEQEPYYLVSYERDVIRPRALGSFEDLLIAVAESPAMLLYLDNSASTGPDSETAVKQKMRAEQQKAQGKAAKASDTGLNENYARELMELHTLGVNGGYSQKDVTEVAKVFTGWTVEKQQEGGGFVFDAARHEPGVKTVLGHAVPERARNGGMQEGSLQEGLDVLHLLAVSLATARFVSREIAVAFVSDSPSEALVNRMAKSFVASHGKIREVLRTMVHSPEFWQAGAYRAKVKTPLEYVVSAARASGADVADARPLVSALNQMGMPLYGCVPPTGYGDKSADWVSTGALVTRMNFALSLATNHYPRVRTPWVSMQDRPAVLGNSDVSPEQVEALLEKELVAGGVSEKTRAAVMAEAGNGSGSVAALKQPAGMLVAQREAEKEDAKAVAARQWKVGQMAGLLMGSPEFQRR